MKAFLAAQLAFCESAFGVLQSLPQAVDMNAYRAMTAAIAAMKVALAEAERAEVEDVEIESPAPVVAKTVAGK